MTKRKILLCALLLTSVMVYSRTSYKLAGVSLEKYSIVYSAEAEDEEGKALASDLQKKIQTLVGKELPVFSSDKVVKGAKIVLTHSAGMKTFDYSVKTSKGKIVVDGGGCWAMRKAADKVLEQMRGKGVSAGYSLTGSVDGEFLFPRREDVSLRILDDNIWDYSHDVIPEVWKKAGLDCRDQTRAPEFAQLVRAYMPDVVTFQEYSSHMHKALYGKLQKYGYVIAYEPGDGTWNCTPVFYNKESTELVEVRYTLFTPVLWSNKNSKSYTAVVLKQKSTGKIYAVLNAHLWWKSDKAQPGSTYARASQVRLMMAEAEIIRQKYDCPVFVTGDMNCEEESIPMQQFIQKGYVPCYKAATVYGNRDNGHHVCGPTEVGIRKSYRKGSQREVGAIDHCFIYNAKKETEVKVFDCIQAYFTVKLTDHYPNLIDVRL